MAALAYPRSNEPSWHSAPAWRPRERHLELVWSRPEPVRPSRSVFVRRRVLALVLVLLVGVGTWSVVSAGVSWLSGDPAGPAVVEAVPASSVEWRVQSGDTLWQIARSVQPTGDIRPLVSQMSAERNGAPLEIGETIRVPR